MDISEVRRHIELQAYHLEHFITYDPKKVFKEENNANNKINSFQKKKKGELTVYDNDEDINNKPKLEKVCETVDNNNYELNVEKDLYGIDNEANADIKDLMKDDKLIVKKEATPIKNILTEKEQYLFDIETARNSKKRRKMTSVLYE